MPELPEVEVVCRSLRQAIIGRTITAFQATLPKLLKLPYQAPELFAERLIGAQIVNIRRRGKYILIGLNNDDNLTVHLRMTGKLLYQSPEILRGKHCHIVIAFDNGYELRFDDVRQFGSFYLTGSNELQQINGLAALGIEPLGEEFTLAYLQSLIKGKTQKAKAFLLDQRHIAGIGNIYADEILFEAHIHPAESIGNIVEEINQQQLWQAIRHQLSRGIEMGGSSIKDYVDSFGQAGSYQEYHCVYGRSGQPCRQCGTTIERMTISGRGSCYCPNCQRIMTSARH